MCILTLLLMSRFHKDHLFVFVPCSISSVCSRHTPRTCGGWLDTPTAPTASAPAASILHTSGTLTLPSLPPFHFCPRQSSDAHNMGHASPLNTASERALFPPFPSSPHTSLFLFFLSFQPFFSRCSFSRSLSFFLYYFRLYAHSLFLSLSLSLASRENFFSLFKSKLVTLRE